MAVNKQLPSEGTPVVNLTTGLMSSLWYRFFLTFSSDALVDAGGTGYVVATSTGYTTRTLTANSSKISIVNGSGISGTTTFDVNQANLSIGTTQLTGTLQAAQFPALTGDITTSAGNLATTLANSGVSAASYTINGNALFTVDAKGRITAASNATVTKANIGIARGSYTVTAGDDTANTTTINTGLTINTAIVQIIRSGKEVSSDPAISWATTNLTVADGATYVLTAGDVINWIALS